MRFSNEIKSGLVIIIAVLIGAVFVLKTTNFQAEPYELKTVFGYAGDLKSDATVKLSGIEVGRVTGINFVYDTLGTKVECTLSLDQNAKIRKDSIAYIATSGFVGDAYVGLTGGTSSEFLKQGEMVKSEDPVEMRELMKKADSIADSVDSTLKEVKGLASNLNGAVSENRPGISNIVSNLEGATENIEAFSKDLKKHPWKLMFKGE